MPDLAITSNHNQWSDTQSATGDFQGERLPSLTNIKENQN